MNEMLSLTPAGMGILRLAIIIPELRLADPTFNSQVMASALASAAEASEPAIDPALERLRRVDPDQLAPREALDVLYELKALLQ